MVSDQPSWGRRPFVRSILSLVSRFRPTLVGSEVDQSLEVGVRVARFRPTLVGSEVPAANQHDGFLRVSDQPSWGRRYNDTTEITDDTSFRPTLVGSEANQRYGSVGHCRVSDQPSWGRRIPNPHPNTLYYGVSDQPSWGRRRDSLERRVQAS